MVACVNQLYKIKSHSENILQVCFDLLFLEGCDIFSQGIYSLRNITLHTFKQMSNLQSMEKFSMETKVQILNQKKNSDQYNSYFKKYSHIIFSTGRKFEQYLVIAQRVFSQLYTSILIFYFIHTIPMILMTLTSSCKQKFST